MTNLTQYWVRVEPAFDSTSSVKTTQLGVIGVTTNASYSITNKGRIPVILRIQVAGAGGTWATLMPGETGGFNATGTSAQAITLDAYRRYAPIFVSVNSDKFSPGTDPQHIGVLQVTRNA